jgi:hypothetical protein
MDMVDELVAQRKVLLLRDAREVDFLVHEAAVAVRGCGGEPYGQYLWLQSDLGCDAEEQLHDVGLDVFAHAHAPRADGAVDKVHERHGKDIVFEEVFLLAVDEGVVEGDGVPDHALVVRRGSDLGDTRVDLVGGGELQAQVRCRRARLIVEDCGERLEPAADVAQGLAVAGEVLRLLPCLLERPSACDTPSSLRALPGLGCIVVGSVPDAAEGCLVRLASSGRSRRGASPTAAVSDARAQRRAHVRSPSRYAIAPHQGRVRGGCKVRQRAAGSRSGSWWLKLRNRALDAVATVVPTKQQRPPCTATYRPHVHESALSTASASTEPVLI